jgi:hypothetical protein
VLQLFLRSPIWNGLEKVMAKIVKETVAKRVSTPAYLELVLNPELFLYIALIFQVSASPGPCRRVCGLYERIEWRNRFSGAVLDPLKVTDDDLAPRQQSVSLT